MNVLILYSSTEGQSKKIAMFLQDELKESGNDVLVERVAKQIDPNLFDAVIITGSIHVGQYANDLADYVATFANSLNKIPSIFYSVSLSVTNKDSQVIQRLHEITRLFLTTTKWTPRVTEQVAGALLYTKYGFIKRMLIRSIMKKSGGDTNTSRDYEYTDLNAVRSSLHNFMEEIYLVESH
jgi:menaquinone-dependent protoporphyrinogen oxidase